MPERKKSFGQQLGGVLGGIGGLGAGIGAGLLTGGAGFASIPALMAGGYSVGEGIGGMVDPSDPAAERQRQLQEQALAEWYGIQAPTDLELQGPSAMEGVQGIALDPRFQAMQMDALNRYDQIAREGGNDIQYRAAMDRARAESARQEQAQRQALANSFAARGAGGSGFEQMAQLQGQQASANRNAMAGTEAAAEAQRRAMGAVGHKAELAGQMQGQGLGVARTNLDLAQAKANAADARARLNSAMRQQNFDNRYRLANGRSNAALGMSGFEGQMDQRNRDREAGTLETVGKLGDVASDIYDAWGRKKRQQP